MKKIIPINDKWRFRLGADKDIAETGVFEGFRDVELPHCSVELKSDYFEPNDMRAVSCYVRSLHVPSSFGGSRLLLQFDGADSYAEVYCNGQFVTAHKGGTPFTADITAPVKFDYDNTILVKTDARVRKDVPSVGKSAVSYGGIHRKVSLIVDSGASIRDVRVIADTSPEIAADVTLEDFYPNASVEAFVTDFSGNKVGSLAAKSALGECVRLTGTVENPVLWEPENPVLYTLTVRLTLGKRVSDEVAVPFGFRTAAFYRDGFRLNGKRVKLIGLNRVDCFPNVGRAAPDGLQCSDAQTLKDLGCNCVRTIGQPAKAFVDACDKIGLMVIEDLGGDGFIGDTRWKSALVEMVGETVLRDRNAPSVIAWGVRVDKSADCDELYFKTSKAAKDLDPTRATLGARSNMGSRFYEDVFGFSEWKGVGLSRPRKTARLFIPYVVTEHSAGAAVKNYDPLADRRAQAYAHLGVLDKVYGSKTIDGCFGSSFADYYAPRVRGDGDSVCHSGVVDMYRNYKPAAYAYASQADFAPILYPLENVVSDRFDGKLTVFTNCDSVRLVRGETVIGEFFPDRKRFKHLPHPPVIVDDFLGTPAGTENLGKVGKRLYKLLLDKIRLRGMNGLRTVEKFGLWCISKRMKTDVAGVKKIAEKQIGALVAYRLDGIKNGEVVISRNIGYTPQSGNRQIATVFAPMPPIVGSYEMACVQVAAVDGFGAPLSNDNSPIKVTTAGDVALVGKEQKSFSGGMTGFYVKSVGDGEGRVTVSSRWGKEEIIIKN